MLSVVVYGRNDAHGYNLHKRAAISLNAIAQVLTSDDDEIIFIDYNSPDEIPTFPEAIADTLTPLTRKRLRIIRVRPEFHHQFADRTPLVALEAQSRNIAIRRSNPDNRWILSTNTDMVIVPQDPSRTLTSIATELEDGFYHLPRFEVPEGFWERLDRLDPVRAIERMRRWGTRFHFNEVVLSGREGLYEAPGDFQLFRREDLFSIAGFDERMILGWHVDSNIARRMWLLNGRVDSAFGHLMAYHCGHTRQATIMHRADRTENSLSEFVDQIEDPVAWSQVDSWGAPRVDFEEIRLDAHIVGVHLDAILAAVPREGAPFTETDMGPNAWTRVDYDPNHVLPHLCDLLYHVPPGPIFVSTADVELLGGLHRFLETAHGHADIVLAEDHELIARETLAGGAGYRWLPFVDALEAANCLIVVNPGPGNDPRRSRDMQWFTQTVLDAIIAAERQRKIGTRRRLIVVNALGHPMQNTIHSSMSFTQMPPSLRLRHGYVIDPPRDLSLADYADETERAYYRRLGRISRFTPDERELLGKAVRISKGGAPKLHGWERLAPELAALAEMPEAAEGFGLKASALADLRRAATTAIEKAVSRCIVKPARVPPRLDTGTRLCSGEDWEAPEWYRLLRHYWAGDEYSLPQRRRWTWERMAMVIALRRQLEPMARPWVLIVAESPDFLAAFLADLGYRIAYTTMAEFLGSAPHKRPDWSSETAPRLFAQHSDLWHLADLGKAQGFLPGFAGVVLSQNILLGRGEAHLDSILTALKELVIDNAVLVASADVHLNDKDYRGALTFGQWCTLFSENGLLGARNIVCAGSQDPTIPHDTAVRFAREDHPEETIAGLSYGYGDAFVTVALITACWPDPKAEMQPRARPPFDDPLDAIVADVVEQSPMLTESNILVESNGQGEVAHDEPSNGIVPEFGAHLIARAGEVLVQASVFADIRERVPRSLTRQVKSDGKHGAVTVVNDDVEKTFVSVAIDAGRKRTVIIPLLLMGVDAETEIHGVFLRRNGKAAPIFAIAGEDRVSIKIAADRPLGRGVVVVEMSPPVLALDRLVAAQPKRDPQRRPPWR